MPTAKSDTSSPRQSWYRRGARPPPRAGLSPLPCGEALDGLRRGGRFPAAHGSSVLGPAGSAVGVRLHREAAGCCHAAGEPFFSAPDEDTRGRGAPAPAAQSSFPVGPRAPSSSPSLVLCGVGCRPQV